MDIYEKQLRHTLKVLERAGCQFQYCPGPNKPFVNMATCFVCDEIRNVRALLKKGRANNACTGLAGTVAKNSKGNQPASR
jgi:hypothetical protein